MESKWALSAPVVEAACCHLAPVGMGGPSPKQNYFIMIRYETICIRTAPLPPPTPQVRIIVREQYTESTNSGTGSRMSEFES